jgi:hypothetical protein
VKSYKEKKRDFGKLGRNGTIMLEAIEEAILTLGFPSPPRGDVGSLPRVHDLLGLGGAADPGRSPACRFSFIVLVSSILFFQMGGGGIFKFQESPPHTILTRLAPAEGMWSCLSDRFLGSKPFFVFISFTLG